MTTLFVVIIALLAVALAAAGIRIAQLRAKFQHRGTLGRWPIPRVHPSEIDPVFEPTPMGPSRETEVAFISGLNVPGGVSDAETWVLSTLAKKSKRIFELGTCTGKTTYLLAKNCPEDGEVVTITLDPNEAASGAYAAGDDAHDRRAAARESAYATFYYTGTDAKPKIRQLFGDSKQFDESPYANSFDLIFIDGSHAESYVESDSRKALKMVRPGGLILWHDYRGPRRAKGVFRALNRLAKELPLKHIDGTTLVCYRRPK